MNTPLVAKLVFGTDNPAPPTMLEFYANFFERLGVDEAMRQQVMVTNAARILGLDAA